MSSEPQRRTPEETRTADNHSAEARRFAALPPRRAQTLGEAVTLVHILAQIAAAAR